MTTPTVENERPAGRLAGAGEWLALIGFLVYAVAAPHSIAGSWMGLSAAIVAWLVRFAATRRPGIRRTPFDLPLWLFFGWTALSCVLSAEPRLSVPKPGNVPPLPTF